MYQHFRRGSKAAGNKTKEMKYLSLNFDVISFVLFTSAREPNMNYHNSSWAYWILLSLWYNRFFIFLTSTAAYTRKANVQVNHFAHVPYVNNSFLHFCCTSDNKCAKEESRWWFDWRRESWKICTSHFFIFVNGGLELRPGN